MRHTAARSDLVWTKQDALLKWWTSHHHGVIFTLLAAKIEPRLDSKLTHFLQCRLVERRPDPVLESGAGGVYYGESHCVTRDQGYRKAAFSCYRARPCGETGSRRHWLASFSWDCLAWQTQDR
jgi:hypothetical protein